MTNLETYKLSTNYVNSNGYRGGFFLNNKIQFLSIASEYRSFNNRDTPSNSYGTPTYLGKQVCTGLIYKRNAQEALFGISTWSDADYKVGVYDIDNTKAEADM